MNNPPSEASPLVLKTDTRGRVFTPPSRREQLLNEFEQSGLCGAKFAALVGVKYQTFAAWALRRKRARGLANPPSQAGASPATVRWLEAVVQETQVPMTGSGKALGLQLPRGVRAELSDARQIEWVVALVRALEQKPC